MQNALALADKSGRFLFEIRPDLFPEGYLTLCEEVLWYKFHEQRNAAAKANR